MTTEPTAHRTIEQIEADLARGREELAQKLDALTHELNPRTQAAYLAEDAKSAASAAGEQAKATASAIGAQAKGLAHEAAQGKPKAIAIAGGLLAAVVGIAVAAVRRRR